MKNNTVSNYVPIDSDLQNIYNKWGKLPFSVVQKRLSLIDSLTTLRQPAAILLSALLNPLNNNISFHN